jgi:hypothetical protein
VAYWFPSGLLTTEGSVSSERREISPLGLGEGFFSVSHHSLRDDTMSTVEGSYEINPDCTGCLQ